MDSHSIHKLFLERDKPLSQMLVRKFYLTLILWLLSKEDLHGYAIIKKMESFDMGTIKASRVYPFLGELEALGLITKRREGRKKVYSITKDGKRVLSKLRSYLKKNPIGQFLKELVS